MFKNLLGELRIMKDFGVKPNYSALQREYNVDRHTIKKYYDNNGIPPRKERESTSKWDQFIPEIEELLKNTHTTYRAIWNYLEHVHSKEGLPGGYDSMRNYLYRHGYHKSIKAVPHVLYETEPGKQAQFDWKEDMRIHLVDGSEIIFNVFSLTLSYSREHIFIYSSHKTSSDLLRCLIEANNRLGGTCEEYLTDNMSAIVTIKDRERKVHSLINAFFKDIGAKLKLAKPRTPQTKGKDENANKFVEWIYPYDYKIKDEMELIDIIENVITSQANRQINTGTGLPPNALFQKEKEYLHKLPNRILMDSYLKEHSRQVVPPTQLIYYNGCKYSLSSKYIGETVDIYPCGDELYIYLNQRLIAKHIITQQKINYTQSDYEEGLKARIHDRTQVEIEEMATRNLARLARLGRK